MSFTDVFGGNTIYPAEPSYLPLALSADVVLEWPTEQAVTANVLAKIIDVTPSAGGLSVTLPDARQGSTGYVSTFYNAGSDTYTVKDANGGTVLTVGSGEAWNLYLRDNTTLAGAWRIFQMGAGTSSGNASALAGAGLVAISTTLNEEMEILEKSLDYVIVDGDRARAITWIGAAGNLTLPDPAAVGVNWFVALKNNGSGSVTITPAAGTIDGSGTLVLGTTESTFVVSDGTDYLTVGFGQTNNSVFDFISIDVAGTGDFTLTGAQLNRVAYEFTGILTGNRNIIVPATIQQYWVTNSTTGAFTLTVKASGGDPGVEIGQNIRSILYCDGTNVVNADDASSISFPITPTQGGTGLAAYAEGDLIYASAVNTLAALSKGAAGSLKVLANTGANNVPKWEALVTTGAFTATLTGLTAALTGDVSYTIIGNMCTLRLTANILGTSNSTGMTMTGLPAAVVPSVDVSGICGRARTSDGFLTHDNALHQARIAAASNVISLEPMIPNTSIPAIYGDSTFWHASGGKGLQIGWTFTYPLS